MPRPWVYGSHGAGLLAQLNATQTLPSFALFYLIIRYGVIARDEAYLDRKFGDVYLAYKAGVGRWL